MHWNSLMHCITVMHATMTTLLPLCCLPSAADMKPLYRSSSKAALLGQLFERLAASLEASGALPPLASSESSSEQQPAPQVLVW